MTVKRAAGPARRAGTRGGRKPAGGGPLLLEIEIYLTNRCNMDCTYCSSRHMIHEPEERKLSPEQLRRLVDLLASDPEVKARFGGRVGLDLKGGEPLLDFGLIRGLVDYVRDRGLDFKIGMSTNGTLLTPDRMAFLDRNNVEVCVALDGQKSVNDFHRRFRGAPGRSVFDAVMANLKRGSAGGKFPAHMHIGTTFTPKTVGSMPEAVEFFRREVGSRQVKIGLEVYDIWPAEGIRRLRAALRVIKARFLRTLQRELARNSLETAFDEIQFSQYMRNMQHSAEGGGAAGELASNPIALFYDGRFYPSDLALATPVPEAYCIGDLERGLDFGKLDKLSSSSMFADLPRGGVDGTGLLSQVERRSWGVVHGFSREKLEALKRNTTEVNEVFDAGVGACVRLQRTCERLFLTPGFGDFTHEPRFRGGKEMRLLRQTVNGALPLPRLREAADFFLYSPGAAKRLVLDARAGGPAAADLAEALAVYALIKTAYLKKKLSADLLLPAGPQDPARLASLAAHGVRVLREAA